jgi:hypothetical protein
MKASPVTAQRQSCSARTRRGGSAANSEAAETTEKALNSLGAGCEPAEKSTQRRPMPTGRFERIALAQLLLNGCAVMFGVYVLIESAQAQQPSIPTGPIPAPPTQSPTFNPSTPYTLPSTRETPVSPGLPSNLPSSSFCSVFNLGP